MRHHKEVKTDVLSHRIIGLAIEVHSKLGPELSEHVYCEALCVAIEADDLKVVREKEVSIYFRGQRVGRRFIDLLVAEELVLEIKVVRRMTEEHFRQLGMNVRSAQKRRGLLLNFGTCKLGIRRFANTVAGSGSSR